MKTLKIGVVLLALLFAAMTIVPMVSAAEEQSITSNKDLIESNYIPVGIAKEHATVTMLEYIANGLVDENWIGASLDSDPVIIYDINGEKLYYQFSVIKNGKKIGEILSATSKVLGVSVQKIGDPSIFDLTSVQKKAESFVKVSEKGSKIFSSKIVCYSYPKMGVMVTLANPFNNKQKRIIFNALDYSIVPEKTPVYDGDSGAYSYYEKISTEQKIKNIASWQDIDNYISNIQARLSSINITLNQPVGNEKIQLLKTNGIFLSGPTPNANYITPFPKTTQSKTEWCAIATAWLITKFYYQDTWRQQENIASYMGIPSYVNKGPTGDNEMKYYRDPYIASANGGLGKRNSITSYWIGQPSSYFNLIKGEIDKNRPLKIGLNGHARACIGYFKYTTGRVTYKFSDPGTNSQYWEESQPYNNYIAVIG